MTHDMGKNLLERGGEVVFSSSSYLCYYLHTLKDSVSTVGGIFSSVFILQVLHAILLAAMVT